MRTPAGVRRRWQQAWQGPWGWWLALALSTATFLLWPQLDLQVAQWFHAGQGVFPANQSAWVQAVYVGAPRVGQVLFGLALVLLLLRVLGWRGQPGLQRRALAWVLVVLLGVGLIVHEALKNSVGRPRPVQVLSGQAHYVPPFHLSDQCQRNCSFVSGHAAIGFSLMAWGLWSAPDRRRRWWWIGMGTGLGIGAVRMMQGGHFLSDVIFSGLSVWSASWLVQEAGWRRRWLRTRTRQR